MTWEIVPLQFSHLCSEADIIDIENPFNRLDQLRIVLFAYLSQETTHCLVAHTELISSAISRLVGALLFEINFMRHRISRLAVESPLGGRSGDGPLT